MEVEGRKIGNIIKDDQGKPDLAKSALARAYEDGGAKCELIVAGDGS
jgi:hypothetical protein